MFDTDLHQNPIQVGPEPTQPVVGFKPHQSSTQLVKQMTQSKGNSGRYQNLLGTTLSQGAAPNSDSYTVNEVYPIYGQPA